MANIRRDFRSGKAVPAALVAAAVTGACVYLLMRGEEPGNGTVSPAAIAASSEHRAPGDSRSEATPSPSGIESLPAAPASTLPTTVPATQPLGYLSIYDLVSDNLEEVLDDYRMPVELDNETAERLIRTTAGLPAKINRVVELTAVYRQHVNRLTTKERTAEFWLRLETGKGFKDPTIGRDWATVKLDNMGFISFVEQVVGAVWMGGRLVYINNRIAEVRVTLVGGRVTWGHRRFIESTDHWATQTVERLQRDIRAMAELEQRCQREGL